MRRDATHALRFGHNSPAPTLDEFGSTRFLKTFGKTEGNLRLARRYRPATAKKISRRMDFQKPSDAAEKTALARL
jgi:hypothetical protein